MRPASLLRAVIVAAVLGGPGGAQESPTPVGRDVHDVAGMRVIDLIERHPMAELRHEMWRLIAMDCLWVYTVGDSDPMLTIMNRVAAVCYEPHGCCDGLCPTLYVATRFLLRVDRPDDWRMSVLWHEYLHIRHVQDGMARPVLCGTPELSTDESVAAMVVEELRAYESEYILAASIGLPPYDLKDQIYREHGRAAMACFLAEEYERLPLYEDHVEGLRRAAAVFSAKQ